MYHQWLLFATLVANAPPATPPPPSTYITDRLSISLHGANATDAPVVKQVISGAPIKVLSRDGALLKIRTEDGSVGWVERDLVTTETPTHLLYLEVADRLTKAQETIKTLQDKSGGTSSSAPQDESKIVSDLRAEIKNTLEHAVELEKHFRSNSKPMSEPSGRIRELEEENSALREQLATKSVTAAAARDVTNFPPSVTTPAARKFSVSLPWFVISLTLALLLAGTISWVVVSRRLRKLHGGFRVKT